MSGISAAAAATKNSLSFGRVLFDNFETGSRAAFWLQNDYRNMGQVVTTSVDGVLGPDSGTYMWRGNWDGTVAWNDPAAFDTLLINSIPHTNEYLLRVRFRVDTTFQRSAGSAAKLFRTYNQSNPYHDSFAAVRAEQLSHEGTIGDVQLGGAQYADVSSDSSAVWHTYEMYVNYSTGLFKVWIDDVLLQNWTGRNFLGTKFEPFYLCSNFSDAHDATNYLYVDNFEVFSDAGTGGTGSMANGTAAAA